MSPGLNLSLRLSAHERHPRPRRADIPFSRLLKDPSLALTTPPPIPAAAATASDPPPPPPPPPERITFVCRRGNDSLLASRALRRYLEEHHVPDSGGSAEQLEGKSVQVDDLIGGLTAWASEGEEGFPVY